MVAERTERESAIIPEPDDLSTVIRRPGVLRPMALPVFNRAPIRHAVQDTFFPGSSYASV